MLGNLDDCLEGLIRLEAKEQILKDYFKICSSLTKKNGQITELMAVPSKDGFSIRFTEGNDTYLIANYIFYDEYGIQFQIYYGPYFEYSYKQTVNIDQLCEII